MRDIKTIILLGLACTALVASVAGCGGGGSDPIAPGPPNQGDNNNGGDPPEPVIPGLTQGTFSLPGGAQFNDLRGVAASQNFIYVADAQTTYCFNKLGTFLRAEPSPRGAQIRGIAAFPPPPSVAGLDYSQYFLANHPVIVHDPVTAYGYVTIYGPQLDTITDIPGNGPDRAKFIALPNPGQIDPPAVPQPPPGPPYCLRTFDIKVDRFGSILVTCDVDWDNSDPADIPSALQVFNFFDGFTIVEHGEYQNPNDPQDELNGTGIPCFHGSQGDATGSLATIATDTYFPTNRTELTYKVYTGETNLQRDYIGITSMTLVTNAVTPGYIMGQTVPNNFGYSRIIGESFNNLPGSFALDAPRNPDGGFEDDEIVGGGPFYLSVDKRNDNVWITDPGNRRVQQFDGDTGAYINQLGNGARGNAGNSFIAPSRVEVDLEGSIYICDGDQLRVFRASPADRSYGNVGGTVTDLVNGNRLQGATISLGNELGTLAVVPTNINGQYLIQNLLTGTYYLTATKFNYGSDNASVQILSDQTVVANFKLRPNEPSTLGGYSGTIIDDDTNLPINGVLVEILSTSLKGNSDATGAFVINNIPPGTYQVRYSATGYQTVTRQIEILAGQIRNDQLIQLPPL